MVSTAEKRLSVVFENNTTTFLLLLLLLRLLLLLLLLLLIIIIVTCLTEVCLHEDANWLSSSVSQRVASAQFMYSVTLLKHTKTSPRKVS